MDKERIKGMARQVKGLIKEAAGRVTGDRRMQAEGKVEKTEGEIREAAGRVKDKVRDLRDD